MIATLLFLSLSVTSAHSYYMILFATQNGDAHLFPEPKTCHNWATWVEVDENHNVVEHFNISWVGHAGVKFFYGPQCPRNLTLQQTLDRAKSRGVCMTMWGPYCVTECCYQAARRQYEYLEAAIVNGTAFYTVLDRFTRGKDNCPAFNCIHAITGCQGEMINTHNRIGNAAAEAIMRHFRHKYGIGYYNPANEWVWDAVRPEGDYYIQRAD